jgi:hypothetical protein
MKKLVLPLIVLIWLCFNQLHAQNAVVTFKVDMSEYVNNVIVPNPPIDPVKGMRIAGYMDSLGCLEILSDTNWQPWAPGAKLVDIGNDVYQGVYTFTQSGVLEFKFVNGTRWDIPDLVNGGVIQMSEGQDGSELRTSCPDGSVLGDIGTNRKITLAPGNWLYECVFDRCSADGLVTGLKQKTWKKLFSAIPSDETKTVSVSFDQSEEGIIKLVNIQGKTVSSVTTKANQDNISLNTNGLNGGVYILNFVGNKTAYSTKLVIR